jgi:hypothetical protein
VEKTGSWGESVSRRITIGKFSKPVIGEFKNGGVQTLVRSLILDNARMPPPWLDREKRQRFQ